MHKNTRIDLIFSKKKKKKNSEALMAAAGLEHQAGDEEMPHLNHELLMNDYGDGHPPPSSSSQEFYVHHQSQQPMINSTATGPSVMRPANFPEYKH